MKLTLGGAVALGAAAFGTVFLIVVPPWHLPVKGEQIGYRASSMVQFPQLNARFMRQDVAAPALPAEKPDPRPATTAFHNVTVLTGMNAGDFMHLQDAITAWVSPGQGCAFCHQGNDFASDANPHKQAARTMLRMVQHINTTWRAHVGKPGVTCFTCHRGQPVPSEVWWPQVVPPPKGLVAEQEPWNQTATTVRGFFPDASFSEYFLQDTPGIAQSRTALPSGEVASQDVVKRLYEVMMQMSDGIGVNCGYCHNSRALADWNQSPPARWVGYSGIRMTRDLNNGFLLPLALAMPQIRTVSREGRPPIEPEDEVSPHPGAAFVVCATCHTGAPRPLHGLDLLSGFPALASAPAPAPAPAPSPAQRSTP